MLPRRQRPYAFLARPARTPHRSLHRPIDPLVENPMYRLAAALVALALAAGPLVASEATPQQNRMKECNAKAGDKKGDERKAFMSTCLSNKPAAKATPQQERMRACNKQAAGKKGDERREFMSSCLKG
jgi:uncharacterized protein HemX